MKRPSNRAKWLLIAGGLASAPICCPEFELGYSEPVTEPIKTVPGYQWIVVDSDLLGGQPAVKGARLSVSHVLACLAEGMSGQDIARDYPGFPPDSTPEVLRFTCVQANCSPHTRPRSSVRRDFEGSYV